MLDIQKRQLSIIIDQLAKMGCTFSIVTPENERFGALVAAPVVVRKNTNFSPYKVKERVAKMKVGDVDVYHLLEYENCPTLAQLRGSISSTGIMAFGRKSFTVMTAEKSVQCMRLK